MRRFYQAGSIDIVFARAKHWAQLTGIRRCLIYISMTVSLGSCDIYDPSLVDRSQKDFQNAEREISDASQTEPLDTIDQEDIESVEIDQEYQEKDRREKGSDDSSAVRDDQVAILDSGVNDSYIDTIVELCDGEDGTCDQDDYENHPYDGSSCVSTGTEVCDGIDNDCDGNTDEETGAHLCSLANADAKCIEERCRIVECARGFGDCDGEVDNGCEIEFGSTINCGGCGDDCSGLPAVRNARCESGECVIQNCMERFEDCDNDPSNGCERDSSVSGPCCNRQMDRDSDGVNDCDDECPDDSGYVRSGHCGCPSSPVAAGQPCSDGPCRIASSCDGAGNCGSPNDCVPDTNCIYKTYSSHASTGYFFCRNSTFWITARDICRNAGMELVRIDDVSENTFIANNITNETWIGAHDISIEDTWRWVQNGTDDGDSFWQGTADGYPIDERYANWSSGEPNNDDEDCGEMFIDGTWNDEGCWTFNHYICELSSE